MSRERIHFLSLLSVLLRSFLRTQEQKPLQQAHAEKTVSEVAMRKRQVANMYSVPSKPIYD